jgi:flagellar hook protein FlgE
MSFNIALSGIRAASQDLAVTGNNIANASTNGFKESRTEFGDVYTSSIGNAGALSVGSGVRVSDVAQQFREGNISFTDNLLDLAVSGTGFFVTSTNGEQAFTRAGAFSVDSEGFVVNSSNGRLQGFNVDENGNVNNLIDDIEVSSGNLQPQTTGQVNAEVNLDSREIPAQTAFTISDTYISDINAAATGVAGISLRNPQGVEEFIELSTAGTDTAATISAELNNALGVEAREDGSAPAGIEIILDEGYELIFSTVDSGTAPPVAIVNTATTTDFGEGFGFDPLDSSTYNHATPTVIYDSLGNSHVLQQYYIKQPYDPQNLDPAIAALEPNQWRVAITIDGQNVGAVDPAATDPTAATLLSSRLSFETNGAFNDVASEDIEITNWTPLNESGAPIGAIGPLAAGSPVGTESSNFTVLLTGSSQVSGDFEVRSGSQDGTTTGRLAGLSINDEGVLVARYTNGQSRDLSQVALANFANQQGLTPSGNSSWTETSDSGVPLIGQAGTASLGLIQSGALEDSNVDLSEQLVNLIIAQRNFQANSKTIETADSVTQTILNIR